MAENKDSRRKALRHIAKRDGVSYGVASAKLDGMGKKNRKRLYHSLGLPWNTPKKLKPPVLPQETTSGSTPSPDTPSPQFCRHCGAGIGQYRRPGEGTCPKCDPEGCKARKPIPDYVSEGALQALQELHPGVDF